MRSSYQNNAPQYVLDNVGAPRFNDSTIVPKNTTETGVKGYKGTKGKF
jgi:hypothetical protein